MMLNFGVYGTLISHYTDVNHEELVNKLMGCITIHAKLKDNPDKDFYVNKGTASKYLRGKLEISQNIKQGVNEPKVIAEAASYFRDNIITIISSYTKENLISKLEELIREDDAITNTKKNDLLSLAKEDTLAEFLAEIFLYVVTKPNDSTKEGRETIKMIVNRIDEERHFKELKKKKEDILEILEEADPDLYFQLNDFE